MGYNRSGVRRTARMKRRKQLEARLAEKAAGQEGHGKTLKERAKEVVAKVEGAVGAAVDKVKEMIK